MRTIVVAIALTFAPVGAWAVPTTTSAERARGEPSTRHPVVQAAVLELTREIELALRRDEDPPRTQSDFFPPVVAVDLPSAAVVAALRRPIESDPRVHAYVKWQLLSGLPTLDEQTTDDVLQAYRTAPGPLPQPGIVKQQREELDRMIRNARADDEEAMAVRFEQIAGRVQRDNRPILAYRDALFAKLPPGYDALVAGFEDSIARINVGADAAQHTRNVCAALEMWAPTAPPERMVTMARAISQLRRRKGPAYYTRVYWSESAARLRWSKSQESLASVSQLKAAQEFLEERIRNPTPPLKLKEER